MVGLDAAGKTTILYKLKLGEGVCFRPLSFAGAPCPIVMRSAFVKGWAS